MPRLPLLRTASALAAVILIGSAPVQGQSIPSNYRYIEDRQEASLFGGLFDTGVGRFELGPKSGFAVGARYGLGLSGPFGLEGVATLIPTKRDVINPGRDEGDRAVEEAETTLLMIEARLRFALTGRRTWRGIQPFVFGSTGAGARILITDRFTLRVDGSVVFYQLDTPGGFLDPQRSLGNVPENEWVTGRTLTLGLAYRF